MSRFDRIIHTDGGHDDALQLGLGAGVGLGSGLAVPGRFELGRSIDPLDFESDRAIEPAQVGHVTKLGGRSPGHGRRGIEGEASRRRSAGRSSDGAAGRDHAGAFANRADPLGGAVAPDLVGDEGGKEQDQQGDRDARRSLVLRSRQCGRATRRTVSEWRARRGLQRSAPDPPVRGRRSQCPGWFRQRQCSACDLQTAAHPTAK